MLLQRHVTDGSNYDMRRGKYGDFHMLHGSQEIKDPQYPWIWSAASYLALLCSVVLCSAPPYRVIGLG